MTSAMALTEGDLSAMLQTNHPSQGHMSMLSSSAMLSSDAMDLLAGQVPFTPLQTAYSVGDPGSLMGMQRGGLERSSMSSMGSGGSASMSQAAQWAFGRDEKWELDGKGELLDAAAGRASVGNFGGRMDAPLQPSNQLSRTQGLQRYHSAPSSFLQCLAELNEEEFAHIHSPGGADGGRDDPLRFFNENLAPILESAPAGWAKQPEPEKPAPRAMNSTEQYFAIQAENARQAALREPSDRMKPLLRSTPPEFRPRALKNNNLLRQSSSPAELLAAITERESDAPLVRPHDDGLPGDASMYVFNDAMMGSNGAWKMPAGGNPAFSPAPLLPDGGAGKRVRFPEDMMDDADVLATGSLLRHQSLPAPGSALDAAGADAGYDDPLDLYAPCKTRARRGYATHPRSIAERNRRGRISERMKKLQDLVPNMDKQTNTADMLDEAVEYVKHLQLQVKDLSATIAQLQNGLRNPPPG